jgi:hypothetical protein
MFGLLAYCMVGLVVACVVQVARAFLTRLGSMSEGSNPLRLVLTWLVVMAIPYLWVEGQTAMHGPQFEPLVFDLYDKNMVDGDVAYYKVLYAWHDKASVVLVCNGDYQWGGTYRNIYKATFARDSVGWTLQKLTAVNTSEGDSAGFTIPPYW